jgi:succinate-semialdehyde dehydrogenase/glutarate-semialdehyde dehydrogenase
LINYPNTLLFINGRWRDGGAAPLFVVNPATEETIGTVARANMADLDEAIAAAEAGFGTWRKIAAFDRSKILRKAAAILRGGVEEISHILTMEQGKPLAEARREVMGAADTIDWFAEEARRAYGRIVPSRATNVMQLVIKEPVGPAAAFTPWNFPINQAVRKISAALAAGCSVILKGPEETPASCAALVRAMKTPAFRPARSAWCSASPRRSRNISSRIP